MLKKLFFIYCLCLSTQTKSFEPSYHKVQRNYKLQQSFSQCVLGSNPREGYFMSLREQRGNILAFNEELHAMKIWNKNFLKDALIENKLAINNIKPEIVDLLITLGYSCENIIIPLLEKLDLSKLNENAIEVLKTLQKKCTLTQEEQQKAFSMLKEKKKNQCIPLLNLIIKMKENAQKRGHEIIVTSNHIADSDLKECVNIKALKRLFKPQQQDDNQ